MTAPSSSPVPVSYPEPVDSDTLVTKPVTGRKRKCLDPEEAAARKAEQNRLAQKAFRERKDLRIKELEVKVAVLTQLTASSSSTNTINAELLEKIRILEERCAGLERENVKLKDVVSKVESQATPPVSPPAQSIAGYQLPLSWTSAGVQLPIPSPSHLTVSHPLSKGLAITSPVPSLMHLESDAESQESQSQRNRGYFSTVC